MKKFVCLLFIVFISLSFVFGFHNENIDFTIGFDNSILYKQKSNEVLCISIPISMKIKTTDGVVFADYSYVKLDSKHVNIKAKVDVNKFRIGFDNYNIKFSLGSGLISFKENIKLVFGNKYEVRPKNSVFYSCAVNKKIGKKVELNCKSFFSSVVFKESNFYYINARPKQLEVLGINAQISLADSIALDLFNLGLSTEVLTGQQDGSIHFCDAKSVLNGFSLKKKLLREVSVSFGLINMNMNARANLDGNMQKYFLFPYEKLKISAICRERFITTGTECHFNYDKFSFGCNFILLINCGSSSNFISEHKYKKTIIFDGSEGYKEKEFLNLDKHIFLVGNLDFSYRFSEFEFGINKLVYFRVRPKTGNQHVNNDSLLTSSKKDSEREKVDFESLFFSGLSVSFKCNI